MTRTRSSLLWGNLLLNLAHLLVWFLAFWLLLEFQWSHALGLAAICGSAAAADTFRSQYTDIDLGKCRAINSSDQGGSSCEYVLWAIDTFSFALNGSGTRAYATQTDNEAVIAFAPSESTPPDVNSHCGSPVRSKAATNRSSLPSQKAGSVRVGF